MDFLAYIGPGMGGGVIAAIFGIIAAFFLGIWGILYYPIKRAFKNKKNNQHSRRCTLCIHKNIYQMGPQTPNMLSSYQGKVFHC